MRGIHVGHSLLLCVSALHLSACGGDDSTASSKPSTAQANAAPTFSSASTTSVAENSSGVFYSASAADSDGDTLTFSLEGGADASLFNFSGQDLSFAESPDFERPADSDRDNVYNVVLNVRDGKGGSASLDLSVSIENDKEGIAVTRIATGFTNPAGLALRVTTSPGTDAIGRVVVAQTTGELFDVNGGTGERTLLADVFENRPRGELLAVARAQNDTTSRYTGLYFVAQEPDGRVYVQTTDFDQVLEVSVLPSGSMPVSATIFEGVNVSQYDGSLLMTLSDETGAFAQDPNSFLGKLIFLREPDPYAGASLRLSPLVPSVLGTGLRRPGGSGVVNG